MQISLKRTEDRDRGKRARRLQRAVLDLPAQTRLAMLVAVREGGLIIGAYADRRGRVCPMLAAHRRGGRTDVGDFPRAWDAFGDAHRPRLATPRELEVLGALLEESLDAGSGPMPSAPLVSAATPRAVGCS
jgi:hypothetical protein